jgi:hypothetical protein
MLVLDCWMGVQDPLLYTCLLPFCTVERTGWELTYRVSCAGEVRFMREGRRFSYHTVRYTRYITVTITAGHLCVTFTSSPNDPSELAGNRRATKMRLTVSSWIGVATVCVLLSSGRAVQGGYERTDYAEQSPCTASATT